MIYIELNPSFLRHHSGTSEGTQSKYYKDGYWYKTDLSGSEGEVEYLCSGILQFSDLRREEYVVYERVEINGRQGCRSADFLQGEECFITFDRLHKNVSGIPMHQKVNALATLEEQVDYVKKFIRSVCHIDITDYFKKTFTLDAIILNEDRHFNNLGVIMNADGNYRTAPIFDNGKSLLCGNFSVKENLPISENVKRVIARPFGGTHQKISEYFGKGFALDTASAIKWLEEQEESYQRDVLKYQLEQYQKEKERKIV